MISLVFTGLQLNGESGGVTIDNIEVVIPDGLPDTAAPTIAMTRPLAGDVCQWFEDVCHLDITHGEDTLL